MSTNLPPTVKRISREEFYLSVLRGLTSLFPHLPLEDRNSLFLAFQAFRCPAPMGVASVGAQRPAVPGFCQRKENRFFLLTDRAIHLPREGA